MSNYFSTSQFVKDSYERKSVPGDKAFAYTTMVDLHNDLDKMLLEENTAIEEKKKQIMDTYAPAVANEKLKPINEEEAKLNERIRLIQNRFDTVNDNVRDARLHVLMLHMTNPPTDEEFRILQMIEMQKNVMSDTEWEMYTKRILEGGNYSALALLNAIGKETGHDFAMPKNPDDTLDDINNIHDVFARLIRQIGKPSDKKNYADITFVTKGSKIYEILEKLDSDLSSSVPDPNKKGMSAGE